MTSPLTEGTVEPRNDEQLGPTSAPPPYRMSRNQRVFFGITGVTLGIVVGVWMMLMLSGIMAEDAPATDDPQDLQDDLQRLQEDVDALAATIAEAEGRMAADEGALASTLAMVDEVQGNLDELSATVSALSGALGDQGGDLDSLSERLASTRAQLDATRADLMEALLRLEYARGRQDGTQVFVNMTTEDLSGVLTQLADAIDQMQLSQQYLADVLRQLEGALGGGPPDGYALPKPHLVHYESPLINFQCAMCHNANPVGELKVYDDTLYFNGSLASVDFRVKIDKTAVCSACHDWFPDGEMDPEYKERSCVQRECHDDWARDMNSPYVNEDNVTPDDCLLCHGARPFYPR